MAYDYFNGRILSKSDIDKDDPKARYKRWAIGVANKRIDAANTYKSEHFLVNASIALSCFLVMFTANTGMNLQQIIELPWGDSYEVGEDTQDFRDIKYRADDKEVSFFINASFLTDFKKYIELRSFLVSRFGDPGLLFFRYSSKSGFKTQPIVKDTIQSTVSCLTHIDPNIRQITAKEWRAAKSDYLIKHKDVQTAAILLQSSEQTVLENYSRGSDTNNIGEMSEFLGRFAERIKVGADKSSESTDNSMGSCTDFGNPDPEDNPSVEPDCRQGEGCLYCNKFVVHADEKDVKKLFSCKFCIESTSHLSGSVEQFALFFGDVIKRIEAILSAISSISGGHLSLVERIEAEVFEDGELDSYWEAKYEQLQTLGVV